MNQERMGRHFLGGTGSRFKLDKETDDQFDAEGSKVVNPVKVDTTPRVLEAEKTTWKGAGSEKGLYSEDDIEAMLIRHAGTFAKLGYKDVCMVPNSTVVGYDKTIYAVEIQGVDKHKTHDFGWVTLQVGRSASTVGEVSYVCHIGTVEQVLDVVQTPENFAFEWLQDQSESRKIVKSRPMWMYPELFDLSGEEVLPKNADIAVVGDPYQTCDRERTTIIEYEYADEIVPPVLQSSLHVGIETTNAARDWLESLYYEDLRALELIYGQYSPETTNPYRSFAEVCIHFVNECTNKLATGEKLSPTDENALEKIRTFKTRLIDGSWTLDEGRELIQLCRDASPDGFFSFKEDDLDKWYEYKQEKLMGLGNPERWKEYIARWENYLAHIPKEYLDNLVPNLDKKIQQAIYWLGILPTAKSPERSMAGRNYLNNFYEELLSYYGEDNPEARRIFDPQISHIEERGMMSDNVLGFFMPGYPLNKRQRTIIEEFSHRAEQIVMYSKTIHPKLEEEKERLSEHNVPLSKEALYSYLHSFEHAYARQHFFYKRTQKAIPVHGFFPHNMPPINQQDRILALTSVTMHGWNSMNETGFRRDIEAALPYLKIGGKYILGPINQEIYFGNPLSNFDAVGLTHALQSLREAGKIDYSFKKGQRDYRSSKWDGVPEDALVDQWSPDPTELLENESAASLTITRLI